MKDSKLIKSKDFINNIKILKLSDKIIQYGSGYVLSNSDIAELCQVFNGYLHLMERVKDYERDVNKESNKQRDEKTKLTIYSLSN